jgi:hypothetical protein
LVLADPSNIAGKVQDIFVERNSALLKKKK